MGRATKKHSMKLLLPFARLEGVDELHRTVGRDGRGEQKAVGELQLVRIEVDADTVVLVLEPAEEGREVHALHLVVEERVAEGDGHAAGPGVDVGRNDVHVLEVHRVELDVAQEVLDGLRGIVGLADHIDLHTVGGGVVGLAVGNHRADNVTGCAEILDVVIGLDNCTVVDDITLGVVVGRHKSGVHRGSGVVGYRKLEEVVETSLNVRIGVLDDHGLGSSVGSVDRVTGFAHLEAVGSLREGAASAFHDVLIILAHSEIFFSVGD